MDEGRSRSYSEVDSLAWLTAKLEDDPDGVIPMQRNSSEPCEDIWPLLATFHADMCESMRRVPKAEELVGKRFQCLDHGYIELLDYMGSDAAIEEAARASYEPDSEERTEMQRTLLLRYLLRHRHTTPFEMVELKFKVAVPMFVWRQWIRHRTASVNELSGRYVTLPDLFYTPETARMQKQSSGNHQGSSDELVDNAEKMRSHMERDHKRARGAYEARLEGGLSSELARINLPLSQYTVAIWKINLHNLFHFLALRLDPAAQFEIRVYAEAIADIVSQLCPIAWQAFEDYRRFAVTFTAPEQLVLASMLRGDNADLDFERLGLSKREVKELVDKLRGMGLDVKLSEDNDADTAKV